MTFSISVEFGRAASFCSQSVLGAIVAVSVEVVVALAEGIIIRGGVSVVAVAEESGFLPVPAAEPSLLTNVSLVSASQPPSASAPAR